MLISLLNNWELIKEVPKVRQKPITQQHQIYRGFITLSINSVNELAVEKQNIEYKSNELMVYYKDDLTNMDSSLNNIIEEETQLEIQSEVQYHRNPIKLEFWYAETPSTKNEMVPETHILQYKRITIF
uniref:Uncharacterized protein n=1 Tax=Glossina pallidipes TaxID=7398 RepID=A0A1A9ZJV5_GLOPL